MNSKLTLEVNNEILIKLEKLTKEKNLSVDTLVDIIIENQLNAENNNYLIVKENTLLRQHEDSIFQVADTLSDGMYLADKNNIIISVNKSYTKITGLRPDEVLGKNIQEVLNERYLNNEYIMLQGDHLMEYNISTWENIDKPHISEKPSAICTMVLKQKKEISLIGAIITNNIRKTVIFTGKPYFDDTGAITHVLVIIREIGALSELTQKLLDAETKNKKYLNELIHLRNSKFNENLIAKDSAMEKVLQIINHVSKTDATVLITGETGVGKEIIAQEIYKKSHRDKQPYIKVNCAAIPESLIESELFGYEKGAFTGADKKEKLGYFEIAQGGTLLLDEIGELPIKMQSKLLRVLQEKEITRIGGTMPIKLDVRIIAATNQNLKEQIKKGLFREDLYYRLNVIPIEIPPLRNRKADITLLAYKFLNKYNKKYTRHKEFEENALQLLENYSWPGNVRELQNTVERLVIISDSNIIEKSNVINIIGGNSNEYSTLDRDEVTLKEATDIIEKTLIEKALKKHKSSRKAALVLGVTQPTVVRKAKALGIEKW